MPPRFVLFAAVLSFWIPPLHAVPTNEPADAKLDTRGRVVLGYFQQLQASPQFKILSGQFCNYGPDASLADPEKIFHSTGRWPAMISVDYTDFKNKWVDTRQPNRVLLDYWRARGLVGVSVHLNNPARPEGGGLNDRGLNIADLLATDTAIHQRWLRQLDAIAAGLQELQTAGVVVLWRPFHEMNGNWFWWGAQKPEDFARVWRHMFTYFTETKGLHNLIWVYGPNQGEHVADFYPGNQYVDLVGLDAYTDDIDPDHIKGYNDLTALKKPFGFAEYGPHGASNPPGDFDFRRFTDGVERNFWFTRFFLTWNAKWNPAENQHSREFYNDPRVITRADLPPELTARNW